MKSLIVLAFALALPLALDVHAQVPAGAPAGSTGLCKDGSYTSTATKRGACRGHKGVKDWYAADAASSAPATPSSPRTSAAASAPAPTAAAPAGTAPAGSTGLCKDGSYTDTATKRGACRGHKGVQEWYGAPATPAPAKPAPTPAAPANPTRPPPAMTTPAAPVAPTATPAPTAAPAGRTPPPANHLPPNPSTLAPAPGGGDGKVWVNSETKVYHCPSDRYYGKTKKGEYMSEADAIAKGNHAARNKACAPQ